MKTILNVSKGFIVLLMTAILLPGLTAEAARELRGKVYFYEPREPVENVTVRIEETDDADVTTTTGAFRIFLPELFRTGDTVTLMVAKEGYQVLHPLAGKTRIPAEPRKDPVKLLLEPLGSHRFMTSQAFELFIKDAMQQAKQEVTADDEPQE
ncbi:hypothetical protein GF339_15070, partial [candidate division KSB3 bacterium]|nr:hypothetical protein [candidate division KSB3 bacterium]